MKEPYESVSVEIILFETPCDVIVTSSPPSSGSQLPEDPNP